MNPRDPPGSEPEQPHLVLGEVVRGGLPGRGSADPVPLIPSILRVALQRRRSAGVAWRAATAGALSVGLAALVVTGWSKSRDVGYVIERSNGETRMVFSDGSTAVVDATAHLGVVSSHRTGAQLHLEEGHARLHFTGGPKGRWLVVAGPYTLMAAVADLEVRWSEGSLSVGVSSGAATVKGPLGDHLPLPLASGQRLRARASDRSWRLGPEGAPASSLGAAGVGLRCRDRAPGPLVADERSSPPRPAEGAAEGAPTVWLDGDGCLVYGLDERGNRMPDFSSAGYQAGGAAIPFVPRAPGTVLLQPGGTGDDTGAIQAALDAVATRAPDSQGLRGAVELGAGTFTLRGSLRLTASGVVLRGQGESGPHATVLHGRGTARSLVVLGTEARPTLAAKTFHRVMDAYVPIGAQTLELDTTTDLQVGDDIAVRSSGLSFERRITALDGKRIVIDLPLTDDLDRAYTDAIVARYRFPERVTQVGIEQLAGSADFDPRSDLGDGILVQVKAVMNAWVRRVHSDDIESGVVSLAESSRWVTVVDASYNAPRVPGPDGWSRAFAIGGQQNLFLRCRSVGARQALHTFSRTAGPNVVLDFVATGGVSRVSVGRWTSGLLLDGVHITPEASKGEVPIEPRGNERGWSETSSVVWNVASAGPRALAGAPPESLYRAQLADRLGDAALAGLARR